MRRLLLVRHGQSEMNLRIAHVVGGQSNASPLTPLGERQARALGAHLGRMLAPHKAPAFVLSSTAVRARDTARLMLEAAGSQGEGGPAAVAVELSDELLELHQGEWEGKRRDECYTAAALEEIGRDPWNFKAPGGESQRELEARVSACILGAALPHAPPGGPPGVVVAHGLAIKCFLRNVLGSAPALTWKVRLDNTGVVELAFVESGAAAGWHVLRVNDTSHLVVEGVDGF